MNSPVSSKPETVGEAWGAEADTTTTEAAPKAPGPLVPFARFLLVGGGVGVAAGAAVPVLASLMPWALANALITIVSTLVSTELHARFTFGTGSRAGWHRHLQSAGSATAAFAVTSAAVLVLHLSRPAAGMLHEQIVYLSAAGLAGIGRFVVLRLFVFAGGRPLTAVQPRVPPQAQGSPALSPTVPNRPSRRLRAGGSSFRRSRRPSRTCAVRRIAPHVPHRAVRPHRRTVGSSRPGMSSL